MDRFALFSNCIPVRGYKRSVIFDLQIPEQYFVPNSLFNLLDSRNVIDIKKNYEKLRSDEIEIFKNYIDFLANNNLGFFCSNEELIHYPKLDLCWFYPSIITNAIIEIFNIEIFNYKSIILNLEKIGCKHLQVKFAQAVTEHEIDLFVSYMAASKIVSVELMIKHCEKYEWLQNILAKYKMIDRIIVYNAPEKRAIIEKNNRILLSFLPLEMDFTKDCGKIESYYFQNNMILFTESQHYNTCLNRKVCIDINGNIKNCPAMKNSFGNIKDITLEEAINMPGFKDLWGIRKDDIDVCKDCEFRYMCTDCRCFIKNPDDIYSQPAKCEYNPYIAKWKNEKGYISVEEWRKQNPNWEKKAKRKPLVKVPQKVE